MCKKTLRLRLAGVLVVCALGAIALSVARATPPKGFSTPFLVGPATLDEIHVVSETPDYGVQIKTRGLSDGYAAEIVIASGGDSGWHSHPGPVFVLVKSGTASLYHADDPTHTPAVYPAGTGFVEGVGDVHIVRNEGDTDLDLAAFFLVPQGAPRRIDQPQPPGWPF